MGTKCKVPTCRSFTNSASGLCSYHEGGAIRLDEVRDFEQRTTQDRDRLRLQATQTFEKFSAGGQPNDYETINHVVNEAVRATLGGNTSKDVFDGLKAAQEQVKRGRLTRDQRNELWQQIQTGFENLKRAREAQKREWEERQRRSKDNYSRLWQQINGLAQGVSATTDWRSARESLKSVQQMLRETELLREDREALRNCPCRGIVTATSSRWL